VPGRPSLRKGLCPRVLCATTALQSVQAMTVVTTRFAEPAAFLLRLVPRQ
jgi:hypothetical protein